MGLLLGVMRAYGVLYASANVPDRKTLEKQWSRLYRIPDVQDAVNHLLEFEVKLFVSTLLKIFFFKYSFLIYRFIVVMP